MFDVGNYLLGAVVVILAWILGDFTANKEGNE
jgi:hypothetical protein